MTARRHPAVVVASVLALGLTLSGCESLPSALDPSEWFSNKKPLPGERRAVFPGGVPGVPQGVPPELVQGYQPPAEPPPIVEAEEPKPKPKPRPRVAAPRPAPPPQRSAPTAVTVQPQQPPPQQQQPAAQSPWPSPQQTVSQPAPGASPFPDPPRR
jgi:hypothetical protein